MLQALEVFNDFRSAHIPRDVINFLEHNFGNGGGPASASHDGYFFVSKHDVSIYLSRWSAVCLFDIGCTSARHSNKFDNLLIYNVLHLHQGGTSNAVAFFPYRKGSKKETETPPTLSEMLCGRYFFSAKSYVMVKK